MRMDIQCRGFPLTAGLLYHTERRLKFELTRSTNRIGRVVVRLGDSNGPRGGEDKFCRIKVVLAHAEPVLVEDSGSDLYAVIERAAERIGRNVARSLERQRENIRPGGSARAGLPRDEESESESASSIKSD